MLELIQFSNNMERSNRNHLDDQVSEDLDYDNLIHTEKSKTILRLTGLTSSGLSIDPLSAGIISQEIQLVMWALREGADPNDCCSGISPVALSVIFATVESVGKAKEIIKLLIHYGADINQPQYGLSGPNALYIATQRRLVPVVGE